MEFIVDHKRIRLDPMHMRFSKQIGKGTSACVYLIGTNAYKLYHPYGSKEKITKEKIEYFKKIPTKQIILSKEAILDKKRNLCGYISPYIEDYGTDSFLELSKERVLEGSYGLLQDFMLLGDYRVLVNDANVNNTVYHDVPYLIDCGRFSYQDMEDIDENRAISYNIDNFNLYFVRDLLAGGNLSFSRKLMNEYFFKLREEIHVLDYFENDMKEETLGAYIKRKKTSR